MTDTIEPDGPTEDDPRDDEDHAATRDEVFASLAAALAHIDNTMDDLREGLSEIINRDHRNWAALKRIDANLGRIARALEEGRDEANDSSAGS
jgi:hypothetical protein